MYVLMSIFFVLAILSAIISIVFGVIWLVFNTKKLNTKTVKLGTIISSIVFVVSLIVAITSFNSYQKQQDKLISQANSASKKAYNTVIQKALDAQSNIIDINNDTQDAWDASINDDNDDDFNDNIEDALGKDTGKNLVALSDIGVISHAIKTMEKNRDYSDDEYQDKIDNAKEAKKALNHYYHLVDTPSGTSEDFSANTSAANNKVNDLELLN